MKRIYLDHNATTPLRPEVLEGMLPYFHEKFGNPSSIHRFGQEVMKGVEEAREQVGRLINAHPREIVFTGSGTEANNLAIKGAVSLLQKNGGTAPDSQKVLSAIRAMMREIADAGPEFSARAALAVGERRVKSIFIHHFMDEDNFDLARSVRCCSHYPLPDGRLMPACTYNVLHRPRPDKDPASGTPEET